MKRALVVLALASCSDAASKVDAGVIYPDPPPFDVAVRWVLVDSAGAEQACPDSGATVDVIPIYMRRGPQPPVVVPCSEHLARITLDPEPKEDSAVQLGVRRGDGAPFAITSMQLAHTPELTFAVTIDRGRIAAQWTHHRGGMPVSCVDLGNPTATVTFTPSFGAPTTVTNADCERGASSGLLPTGASVRIDVTSGGGAGSVDNVIVPTGGLTTYAPSITIGLP